MDTFNDTLAKHHHPIILSLAFIVVFFAASCDVIPICHYLFGCDHHLHAVS